VLGRGEVHTGFWWEKTEGRRLLARSRRSWEDNIKVDLYAVKWRSTTQIDLAQNTDRWLVLVNAVIKFMIP
jgi:hypothetical protein